MQNKRILYTRPEDGGLSIVVPSSHCTEEQAIKSVPPGASYEIVGVESIPSNRVFRNAWKHDAAKKVDVDIPKAKEITHGYRRSKRAAEFAPLDIEATIPAKAAQAEAAREAIRQRYTAMQAEIDASTTADQLEAIIVREGLL